MKHVEVLATYDLPKNKVHDGAAIWAYKKDKAAGRIVNIGSHPESSTSGEKLQITEACFRYAIDGVGTPVLKGKLKPNEERYMNKRTSDNDPNYTRIGDLQYHHFSFEIAESNTNIRVELQGEESVDFSIYLKKGAPAFNSNADHAATGPGNTKTIIKQLTHGKWFVGVECKTTVKSELDGCRGFFNYSGRLSVLNGAAYKIKLVTNK